MLPGKTYKPEDLLHILRRRIWFALVPFALIAAVTAAVARKLRDREVLRNLRAATSDTELYRAVTE